MKRRIQGRDDLSNLSEEGHEVRPLAASGRGIQAVYSSPQRAVATTASLLETLGEAPDPVFDDGLLEVDLEPWSGQTIDESRKAQRRPTRSGSSGPRSLSSSVVMVRATSHCSS